MEVDSSKHVIKKENQTFQKKKIQKESKKLTDHFKVKPIESINSEDAMFDDSIFNDDPAFNDDQILDVKCKQEDETLDVKCKQEDESVTSKKTTKAKRFKRVQIFDESDSEEDSGYVSPTHPKKFKEIPVNSVSNIPSDLKSPKKAKEVIKEVQTVSKDKSTQENPVKKLKPLKETNSKKSKKIQAAKKAQASITSFFKPAATA